MTPYRIMYTIIGIFKINMHLIQEIKIQLKVVTVSLENRKKHLCKSLANNIKRSSKCALTITY